MSSSRYVPLHHVSPEAGAISNRPRIPVDPDGRETHFFLSCEYVRQVLAVALSDAEFGEVVTLAGPSVVCSRPTPGQNIVDPPSPLHFEVHLASLQIGLRFPLHTAHLSLMGYYGVIPGQFSPTTHMFIAGFFARCLHLGVRPFIDIFLHFDSFTLCDLVVLSPRDTSRYLNGPATVYLKSNLTPTLSRVEGRNGYGSPLRMGGCSLRTGGER
ncbi:unnamed protein product [Cuscuta europaea]|uniref:Transposase (putative) gypsy type domain-containing protein n=1 Tax=Cuscuta europaea TaxID=41803 RepID=A0A9P1EMY2_CUSEU|nr:unnamed protein product [Cuscuta europaea]